MSRQLQAHIFHKSARGSFSILSALSCDLFQDPAKWIKNLESFIQAFYFPQMTINKMSSRDILVDGILLWESDSVYCQEGGLVWKDLEPDTVVLDGPSGFSKHPESLEIILSAAWGVSDCTQAQVGECQHQGGWNLLFSRLGHVLECVMMSRACSWREELKLLLWVCRQTKPNKQKTFHKTANLIEHFYISLLKKGQNTLAIAHMGKLSLKSAGRLKVAKSELESIFPYFIHYSSPSILFFNLRPQFIISEWLFVEDWLYKHRVLHFYHLWQVTWKLS